MVRIALTGGIASGKTLVSAELAELGAVVIDSDLLAREVVAPGTGGLARVVERFGPGALRADGSLDRGRLGELVFADDAAREDLNAIVHPLVRRRAAELEAAAAAGSVVVHVIPLLVETDQHRDFDGVVVVDAPAETQVSRLMHRNDLTTQEARARLRAQAPRTDRLEAADWVVDNSGDVASTIKQVHALWDGPIRELRSREATRTGGPDQPGN
ncbi:dephospho-CoA kinase [Tessaracoccus rhinocerotis]|uniref:Dephospho-CoA kinase n=1 Tax=Tessaracoccus rhinocerotis TaxID=1689449 RepID=A0A553K2J1_9ACTN|nr:dephospho-CoA kinase [Tessaracoccus rhinocerotis]TRY18908.1 dephospho-CoA kinase [Tessaracoccus rhinocerotis]